PLIATPPGLTGIVSPNALDPTLSLAVGTPLSGGVISVPVMLDHPRPDGSTGLTEAILALKYDPSVLSVSPGDISLGSIPGLGAGWQLSSVIDDSKGQIGLEMFGLQPI